VPTLQWGPLWHGLLDDLEAGVDRAVIAARFHAGLIAAIAGMAVRLGEAHAIGKVVLSGGVFQNRLLLEGVAGALADTGLGVLIPRSAPANDGGIALGQAAIAASTPAQEVQK
jgi:hydrogenase maturation protein HypF